MKGAKDYTGISDLIKNTTSPLNINYNSRCSRIKTVSETLNAEMTYFFPAIIAAMLCSAFFIPNKFLDFHEILNTLALFAALISGVYWLLSAQLSMIDPANADAVKSSVLANYRAALGAVTSATLLVTLENCKRLAHAVLKFREQRQMTIDAKLDRATEEHANKLATGKKT